MNGKILNAKEFRAWHEEQYQLYYKLLMEKWGLTEADMIISEDNIKKIEQEEIRNVGIFGEDKDDIRSAMVDVSTHKIRPCI